MTSVGKPVKPPRAQPGPGFNAGWVRSLLLAQALRDLNLAGLSIVLLANHCMDLLKCVLQAQDKFVNVQLSVCNFFKRSQPGLVVGFGFFSQDPEVSFGNQWGMLSAWLPGLAGISSPDQQRSLCSSLCKPHNTFIPLSRPSVVNIKFKMFFKCLHLIPIWVKSVTAASSQMQIKMLLLKVLYLFTDLSAMQCYFNFELVLQTAVSMG